MADLSGVLGTWNLLANINQAVYVNNDDSASAVTVSMCNKGGSPAQVSMAISASPTAPTSAEWFRYYEDVAPKSVFEKTGILVPSGKYLVVKATSENVNAVVYGVRVGTAITSLTVSQNLGTAPTWVTPATFTLYAGNTVPTQLSATDAEGEALTYAVTSGALPTGLSLSAAGLLTGAPDPTGYSPGVADATTVTTISATDSRGNSAPRAFSIVKRWADGTSSARAAPNASAIRAATGVAANGVYWIDIPTLGPTQVYCDQTTDGGGWMMLGYAGSVSGQGNNNHIMFHQFGNLATTRANDQTSFSRFDLARLFTGASANSQAMWRRTTDTNVILIHSFDEMWNRLPGAVNAGNMGMDNGRSGYPITTMKMSNSGAGGVVVKTNGRYEYGPSYPGIAWNSSYNQNDDNVGSISTFLVRRSLIYWETNGPQLQNQWFHADPLQIGPSRGPTYGTGKKDIEVYFKV